MNLIQYNIEKDSSARRRLRRLSGSTSVPFIDVEGTYIPGYSEPAIRQAVERAR